MYVAPESAGDTPRSIVMDGKRLSRFMDSIYLDRPCEKLDLKKIQVLNEVRRPLLEHDRIGAVNGRVRDAFARAVLAAGPGDVLEWGCGYHPLHESLPGTRYTGIDIDPTVIAHNRAHHPATTWYEADRELSGIPDGSQDVIVSCFVFHFKLPRAHISAMRRILRMVAMRMPG